MDELDCVRLTRDFEDLAAGAEGTIVHKYDENDFEVEFFDASKETIGVYTISKDHLKLTVPYAASTQPPKNTKLFMKADAYSTFVNMFLALDALWDECHDDTLAGFLSEANPYLFKGKGSADPAIWSEFSAVYAERFPDGSSSLEDAHRLVVDYLEGISDEYSKVYPGKVRLVDAFRDIAPIERWVEAYELQSADE